MVWTNPLTWAVSQLVTAAQLNTHLRDNLNYLFGQKVEPGTVVDYAGAAAPTGWLLCDGSAVSRTTYAALFTAIGTTWGVGDGSTTFNVPDLRGRVVVGVGTGAGLTARALAGTGGEENHALSTAELASHSHGLTDPTHSHGGGSDPGHSHGINDPTHNHTQNAHNHGTTESAHGHTVGNGALFNTTTTTGATSDAVHLQSGGGQSTSNASTGLTINNATPTNNAAATGVTTNGATTGITAAGAAATGITSAAAGSGTAHNTMQPWAGLTKIVKT